MKICFYLDNTRRPDIDYSNPENGNPGIGGTEYMIWTISYYLKNLYEDIDVYILAPIIEKLSEKTINIKCNTIYDAINKAHEINSDILIVRNYEYKEDFYTMIDKLKVNTIIWSHNFENYNSLKYATECKYIKRNVCVSREQYDRLRDHDIYKKSTYIYNALDFKNYEGYSIDINEKENIICYIGAIKKEKAFHILAKNWVEIEKKVPNAKLYVIGGGNLYDNNIKLGKYNIAEESYENKFIKYITDGEGNIKNNIKFWGVLGEKDKLRIMSKSKVGVVNPIAKDETFCISAIEFEALGVPVVGRKRYGLLNTIDNNKSGILFNNEKDMVNAIVYLLENNLDNEQKGKYGKKYTNDKFNIKDICEKWETMFNDIINDSDVIENKYTDNYRCDLKWLREINRKIKNINVFRKLPAILEYPQCIYNNHYYRHISNIKNILLKNIKLSRNSS